MHELLDPSYWTRIYDTGQIGKDGEPNILFFTLARVLAVMAILLAAWIIVRLVRHGMLHALASMSQRAPQAKRRLTTLCVILISATSYVLYFMAFILILFTLGVNWKGLAPMAWAASILGLAVGFGSQQLVRDVITGLFILGEGQFDVGDTITIGDVTGVVEEMGLRVTRLRDTQGRCYTIANGDLTKVFNASRGRVKQEVLFSFKRTAPLEAMFTVLQAATSATLAAHAESADEAQPAFLVSGLDVGTVQMRVALRVPVQVKEAMADAVRREVIALSAAQGVELA